MSYYVVVCTYNTGYKSKTIVSLWTIDLVVDCHSVQLLIYF